MHEQIPTPQQRRNRVNRVRADELQKIELRINDVNEVEIDTRLLNKLRRKISRSR